MAKRECVSAEALPFYGYGQVARHNIGAPVLPPLLHAPFTAVVYFHKVSLFLCPEEKAVHMYGINVQSNPWKNFVGNNLRITPAISESMYLRPIFRGSVCSTAQGAADIFFILFSVIHHTPLFIGAAVQPLILPAPRTALSKRMVQSCAFSFQPIASFLPSTKSA